MDFFDALIRYETDLWNHLDGALRDAAAVTLATLEALRVVHRHEPRARVLELQHDLRVTVGAASKLADRLEAAGLATRAPNPDDRRSSILTLTPAGRREHDRGVAALEAALAAHLAGVGGGIQSLTASLLELDARFAVVAAR